MQKFQVSKYIHHYIKIVDSCVCVCNTVTLLVFKGQQM